MMQILHVAAVRPTKFIFVQLLIHINNPEELGAANRRIAHENTNFMGCGKDVNYLQSGAECVKMIRTSFRNCTCGQIFVCQAT